MIPQAILTLIDRLARLPSVGPRLATRLAFRLAGSDRAAAAGLAEAFAALMKIERCDRCFFFKPTAEATCPLCTNPERNPSAVAIVGKETDLMAIEKAGVWKGRYLVFGEPAERGALGAAERLRLDALETRIRDELGGQIEEICIALPPTGAGDFTATLITQRFQPLAKRITRIGRGVPTGADLEFADAETLAGSFTGRT